MTDGPSTSSGPRAGSSGMTRHSLHEPPATPFDHRARVLWGAGVAVAVLASWLVAQRGLPSLLSSRPALAQYAIQPMLWMGVAGISYAGWRRLEHRPPFSPILTAIAAAVAVVHVGFFVLSGVFVGFGESMVAGRLVDVPRDTWFVSTWLLGLETARAFIFHAWRPLSERAAFAATAGILAIAMTPFGRVDALADSDTIVSTMAGYIVPTIMLSILLTWLADHGGLGPGFAYALVLLAFEWFSRVQPDLEWPALFVIGAVAPVVSSRLIRQAYLETAEGNRRWADMDHRDDAHGERHPLAWALVLVAVGLSLVGAASLMGLRPAVVDGISMEPAFARGDLAIIDRRVDAGSLMVGDVIEFEDLAGRPVVHRIVAIEGVGRTAVFTTQGDNNRRPDEPITEEDIRGRVVVTVPKVGWPAIWFRNV